MELATLVVFLGACAARALGDGPPLHPAPAYVLVGTRDGKIVRCHFDNPKICETFHEGEDETIIFKTIVHGEYLIVGSGQEILRCQWNRKQSCEVYHQGTNLVGALGVYGGFLFAGDYGGHVLKCGLNKPHSCALVHRFDGGVMDIFVFNNYFYIATSQALLYCTMDFHCSKVTAKLHGQTIKNICFHRVACLRDAIFTVSCSYNNYFEKIILSSPDTMLIKNHVNVSADTIVEDITVFKRKIYLMTLSGEEVMVFEERYNNFTTLVRNITPWPWSILYVYETHAMRPPYPCVARTCLEQSPSAVFNYGMEQRALLEARVVRGKLCDARGALVDTRRADRGRSGRAAVFAMGPDGQLLLSAAHRSGLVHITSLFAGGPVAGAGEIHVEDGVVKRVVACSVYYWPTVALNRQVVDELYRRGYDGADDIQLEDCPYTCDVY